MNTALTREPAVRCHPRGEKCGLGVTRMLDWQSTREPRVATSEGIHAEREIKCGQTQDCAVPHRRNVEMPVGVATR